MQPYAFHASPFAFAPAHAACDAHQARAAAFPSAVPEKLKSNVGKAFNTAANSERVDHWLESLQLLGVAYINSMIQKYKTLQKNRQEQGTSSDLDSNHIQLRNEFDLLHEIIAIKHDLEILMHKHPNNTCIQLVYEALKI